MKYIMKHSVVGAILLLMSCSVEASLALPSVSAEGLNLSKAHMAQASQRAETEGRELHILLGAAPTEEHIQKLTQVETAKEAEGGGFKAPIRIFFLNFESNIHKANISTPQSPVVFGDFNQYGTWDLIIDALSLKRNGFLGKIDKIYFDWSTVKFANWNWTEVLRIAVLLKKDGSLYIPNANLASQSTFGLSTVSISTYGEMTYYQKQAQMPYGKKPSDTRFLTGITTANLIRHADGKEYVYSSTSFVNDGFKISRAKIAAKIGPLKFEKPQGYDSYPDIGMNHRSEDFWRDVFSWTGDKAPQEYLGKWTFVKVSSGK